MCLSNSQSDRRADFELTVMIYLFSCMVQFVNQSLVTDPTICPPDFNLSRHLWSTLNRLRTGRVDMQLILFGDIRPRIRLQMWKPTTDSGSYRQSLSIYTISWWFVVSASV